MFLKAVLTEKEFFNKTIQQRFIIPLIHKFC